MILMKSLLAAAAASFCLVALTANAQNGPAPATPPPEAKAAAPRSLSEIMTLQQLRHIKLWFAGHGSNWALADYEIGELNAGFEDVDELLGGGTVDKMVGTPLKELQRAVDDKNSTAFATAYDRLSAGCNACHHALDRAFIAIQRPTTLPYSDQSFAPQK
ncbi:MAG: hypothetical protein WB624_14595 [Xanthobacteraceae bacterium]